MSRIQTNTVATFDYSLHTTAGDLIDQGSQFSYLHGHNALLLGMEAALEGKSAGEEINELITPEGAFGPIIEEQPLRIPSAQFGNAFERIDVGTPIPVKDKDGNDVVLYVQEKATDHALLSRNHPFAGVSFFFEARVLAVRAALQDEIDAKTAYGADGTDRPSSCACC